MLPIKKILKMGHPTFVKWVITMSSFTIYFDPENLYTCKFSSPKNILYFKMIVHEIESTKEYAAL